MKKLLGILLKLCIIIGVLIALSIIALKLLERKPDILREGVEKYFTEAMGMSAKVETTNWIKFYPSLDISLEKISFYEVSDPDFFPMRIEKLSLKMPFISIFFNLRNFETLEIKGLQAKPGVIFEKSMRVDQAEVYDDKILPPEIKVSGLYDEVEMSASIGLARVEKSMDQTLYQVDDETPFSMKIGTISVNGIFAKKDDQPIFEQALLQIGAQVYGPRDLLASADEDYISLPACLLEHGANETLVKAHCTGYFNDERDNSE